MKYISFVIPCYHSEATIESVITEISQKMEERRECGYEIIAVNDCSPDHVLDTLKALAAKDDRIKVVDLAKNFGKPAAMMAGFSVMQGDVVVNLDDDGQCPLDKLWELLAPIEQGYDASYARYPKKKQSAFKNFGSKVNSLMARYLINKPKELYISNFSAYKRFVVEQIAQYKNPYPYMLGLVLQTTLKIANVEMEERERAAGVGHYTLKRSLALWLNGFPAFSVKPLRAASVMGIICAIIGAVLGAVIVARKLLNPQILIGYSSIMAVLLLIGGMIMLMLGLIGEYIGRIYICINHSPQYVIRDTINIGNETREKCVSN